MYFFYDSNKQKLFNTRPFMAPWDLPGAFKRSWEFTGVPKRPLRTPRGLYCCCNESPSGLFSDLKAGKKAAPKEDFVRRSLEHYKSGQIYSSPLSWLAKLCRLSKAIPGRPLKLTAERALATVGSSRLATHRCYPPFLSSPGGTVSGLPSLA